MNDELDPTGVNGAFQLSRKDKQDILFFLIYLLDLKTADEVSSTLEKHYPRRQIEPATRFFTEEMFEQTDQSK